MSKSELIETLTKARVVPVIRHHDPEIARRGAALLAEAGFPVLEITYTVPDAARVIADLRKSLPGAVIGAGTVLSAQEARDAIEAGAGFLVSPCWSDEAAQICRELSVPYLPGGATPGEILHHWQSGATVVKIFPAREIGGPKFLAAVRAVFPEIPLMPTGGVKPENVGDYLDAGAICAGLGGELFPARALEAGDETVARTQIRTASAAMGLTQN